MLMLNELLFLFLEGVSGCLMNLFVVHLHNKFCFVLIGWLEGNQREDVCLFLCLSVLRCQNHIDTSLEIISFLGQCWLCWFGEQTGVNFQPLILRFTFVHVFMILHAMINRFFVQFLPEIATSYLIPCGLKWHISVEEHISTAKMRGGNSTNMLKIGNNRSTTSNIGVFSCFGSCFTRCNLT